MPEAGCWAGNGGLRRPVWAYWRWETPNLACCPKNLIARPISTPGHGEQDQRPDVDVEYEEDALVVEGDVCHCQQRGQSTEQWRVDHQQVRTGLQRRLRLAGRRDLYVPLVARFILDWRVGIRDRGILVLVWHLLCPPNDIILIKVFLTVSFIFDRRVLFWNHQEPQPKPKWLSKRLLFVPRIPIRTYCANFFIIGVQLVAL